MNWYDYVRGYEDGKEDQPFKTTINPLLILIRLTGALLLLVLSLLHLLTGVLLRFFQWLLKG